MVFTIRNKKLENQDMLNSTENNGEKGIERKTTLIISGLVFVVLICYLPYVILRIMDISRFRHYAVDENSKSFCEEMSNPGTEVFINNDI